jgi:hypothetical protein
MSSFVGVIVIFDIFYYYWLLTEVV